MLISARGGSERVKAFSLAVALEARAAIRLTENRLNNEQVNWTTKMVKRTMPYNPRDHGPRLTARTENE
jgi:hypothetical protein